MHPPFALFVPFAPFALFEPFAAFAAFASFALFEPLAAFALFASFHQHKHCANLSPSSLVDINWATVFPFFGLKISPSRSS